MVKMIMELVRNRSFTLITGDSKQSRLRRLKNGVPRVSVCLPSYLISICTIGHHMEYEVWRFCMTKPDAGLITSLPASDPGSTAIWSSKRINPRPQSCLCLTWSGYLFKRCMYSARKFVSCLLMFLFAPTRACLLHPISLSVP